MKPKKADSSLNQPSLTRRSLFKGLGAGVTLSAFSGPAVSSKESKEGKKRGCVFTVNM